MNLGDTPHINVQFYDLEDDIEGEARGTSNLESLSPQVYQGHRNYKTVKGVNFFGPRAEYVVSGSDCGRIFIWRKKGGRLVALMKGDHSVVNCVEPHPHATILATSGIDPTIKIWSPEATSTPHHPEHTDTVSLCVHLVSVGFVPLNLRGSYCSHTRHVTGMFLQLLGTAMEFSCDGCFSLTGCLCCVEHEKTVAKKV